tara:strand:+ start:85 stop:435 length:351 start_codon:yes stop_codon:yes gene_type:complete
MSTHAVIGVKYCDGTISGAYVHQDGGTMTPRIEDFVESKTTTGLQVLISAAQIRGGIRSFHCPPWNDPNGEPETEFLDNDETYVIDESNWGGNHLGAAYSYLVDYETGKISANDLF